jgi:hypothetical protein
MCYGSASRPLTQPTGIVSNPLCEEAKVKPEEQPTAPEHPCPCRGGRKPRVDKGRNCIPRVHVGDELIVRSWQPFLDGARALLARGCGIKLGRATRGRRPDKRGVDPLKPEPGSTLSSVA